MFNVTEIVTLADPERLNGYKDETQEENTYNVGLLITDACYLLMYGDKSIKRDKSEVLRIVEQTIDTLDIYLNKKFT